MAHFPVRHLAGGFAVQIGCRGRFVQILAEILFNGRGNRGTFLTLVSATGQPGFERQPCTTGNTPCFARVADGDKPPDERSFSLRFARNKRKP
ncbi:MAG: hypothetical protein ACRERU_12030 [Methylococcales bacterium]